MKKTLKYTNLTYLKEMADYDEKVIKEMIDIFMKQVPEFMQEITSNFETRNWENLGAVAHKAKSSVLTMGMKKLGSCMESLEHLAKGNLKQELQQKKNNGHVLSEKEKKSWKNVMNEQKSDVNLKRIPELIDFFLLQCPPAMKELKQNISDL